MCCLKHVSIPLCTLPTSAWCPLSVLWHVLKSLFSTSQGVNWYLVSAIVSAGSGGEIAEVYINRGAARISPEKAGGTLGRKKWKWEETKKNKSGENGSERWGWVGGVGVFRFFSNLAQEEAIFLVLVCQIDGTFQIFIARQCKGYCVHYQAGGKKQKYSFIAKSFQLIRILCAFVHARYWGGRVHRWHGLIEPPELTLGINR